MAEGTSDANVTEETKKTNILDWQANFDKHFPERDGGDPDENRHRPWSFQFRFKKKCERDVIWCTENDPKVQLMMRALRAHGCPVDISRHISCERCDGTYGAFDPRTGQVIACQSPKVKRVARCGILAHELLHAFDFCRAKYDPNNLRHLACTEIRAYNIFHVSYKSAFLNGSIPIYDYTAGHQEFVRNRAVDTLMVIHKVPGEKAVEVVDSVFDKCWRDLEPVGRILKPGFTKLRDSKRALEEGELLGYGDS